MDKIDETQIESWMKLFQEVSEYHWRLNMEPAWERYGGGKRPWQSVALFLSTYAFQTPGVSPNYAPVSADIVKQYKGFDDEIISNHKKLEKNIWDEFLKKIKGRDKPKESGNPLSLILNKQEKSSSLIQRMHDEKMDNLVTGMKTYLQKNKIKDAFDFLDSIRGIGPKIASFFLCSVKEYCKKIQLPKDKTRNCLQPVDIWIRRIVNRLEPQTSDDKIASFIVRHSENPERVNMGMWYFGAIVCGKGWYRFEQVLKDLKTARKEWRQHRDRLKRVCCTHS